MHSKNVLFLLRVSLGWLFLYSGITKILNSSWSAASYIEGATTFPGLFEFFLRPDVLPIVNVLNSWGQAALGVSLILGVFVRWSAPLGALLMALYYLPVLNFPKVGGHSYIVDEHVIYALVLIVLAVSKAGRVWGLDRKLQKD